MKKILFVSLLFMGGGVVLALIDQALGINTSVGRLGFLGDIIHKVIYMAWGGVVFVSAVRSPAINGIIQPTNERTSRIF